MWARTKHTRYKFMKKSRGSGLFTHNLWPKPHVIQCSLKLSKKIFNLEKQSFYNQICYLYVFSSYLYNACLWLALAWFKCHSKYMPKELGQVTPVWTRCTSALARICFLVFMCHSHLLRVESEVLSWISLIKHFPSGIEKTIVPSFYESLTN